MVIETNCHWCKKEIKVKNWIHNKGKKHFCSRSCQGAYARSCK
jgi:hypothetical protein